jgi:hypothetical protein
MGSTQTTPIKDLIEKSPLPASSFDSFTDETEGPGAGLNGILDLGQHGFWLWSKFRFNGEKMHAHGGKGEAKAITEEENTLYLYLTTAVREAYEELLKFFTIEEIIGSLKIVGREQVGDGFTYVTYQAIVEPELSARIAATIPLINEITSLIFPIGSEIVNAKFARIAGKKKHGPDFKDEDRSGIAEKFALLRNHPAIVAWQLNSPVSFQVLLDDLIEWCDGDSTTDPLLLEFTEGKTHATTALPDTVIELTLALIATMNGTTPETPIMSPLVDLLLLQGCPETQGSTVDAIAEIKGAIPGAHDKATAQVDSIVAKLTECGVPYAIDKARAKAQTKVKSTDPDTLSLQGIWKEYLKALKIVEKIDEISTKLSDV